VTAPAPPCLFRVFVALILPFSPRVSRSSYVLLSRYDRSAVRSGGVPFDSIMDSIFDPVSGIYRTFDYTANLINRRRRRSASVTRESSVSIIVDIIAAIRLFAHLTTDRTSTHLTTDVGPAPAGARMGARGPVGAQTPACRLLKAPPQVHM
jgi:hypothetical protein